MIYLASTSPRRFRLLRDAGFRVQKIKPSYLEVDKGHLSTSRLVRNHAIGKALSAAKQIKRGVLISADTLVIYRGKRIGKPRHMTDAFRILTMLQGKTHTVITGVAVCRIENGSVRSKVYFSERTRVTLMPLTRKEMASYFKRIHPLDKAGAYAIQSIRGSIVSNINGSRTNAIGLPMEKLKKVLSMLE